MKNSLNEPVAEAVPPETYLPDHPIFETDLYIPKYVDGRWGDWEISTAKLVLDHGYHTGMWMVRDLSVLLKHGKSGTTLPDSWMSPSAHEIESQELGCRNAFGHTVIMGLGMGWCAINSALNPAVEKVTVVELDPVVIDLVSEMDVIAQAPPEAGEKIRVIHGDALNWEPDLPVDFLYADIWRSLAESGTLDQMRRMQSNIKASQIYLCFFIFGFPGETRDEAEKSIAFLNENAAYIDCVLSANYVISSGSPVDRRPEKWGVVKKKNGKFSVNRGMQADEATKFRNDFRAKCDFGHLMTNRDRFGNFAPGIFTARMLSFLLAAHERLDLPAIEQRMSGGRLDDLYPLMLGEIQWETQGPFLRRLDASRTMVINKVYWKNRRELSRVEAACFEAADGSVSIAEVMAILCRGAENTHLADSRRRTGLAFFREMFQNRQCLGFGKPW